MGKNLFLLFFMQKIQHENAFIHKNTKKSA